MSEQRDFFHLDKPLAELDTRVWVGTHWVGVQSRYVAYCKAHGAKSPDEMTAIDKERYPGGSGVGYILWINGKWREFKTAFNIDRIDGKVQAAFDAWLESGIKNLAPPDK